MIISLHKAAVVVAAIAMTVMLSGCGPMPPVYVSQLNLSYSLAPVANKSDIPCFIMLDPNKVPDTIVNPAQTVRETKIYEIRSFVNKDIKNFFSNYFNSVEVISDKAALPESNYVIVDVAIASLKPEADMITATSSTGATATGGRVFGAMDWAIAVKRDSDEEYLLSFSEKILGTFALVNIAQTSQMYQSTFEAAVNSLAQKYQESKIHQNM
ncbi:MAG: hypothetical protein JXR76_27850 [Deltaproteobacteria bacterium]|nr:hypothetical protein [Deltaproteobacteria bacterium]